LDDGRPRSEPVVRDSQIERLVRLEAPIRVRAQPALCPHHGRRFDHKLIGIASPAYSPERDLEKLRHTGEDTLLHEITSQAATFQSETVR
jgi:hypothetical protein